MNWCEWVGVINLNPQFEMFQKSQDKSLALTWFVQYMNAVALTVYEQ